MSLRLVAIAVFRVSLLGVPCSCQASAARGGNAELTCGAARLTAHTEYDPHVGPEDGFAWLGQTITLQAANHLPPIAVSIDDAPRIRLADGREALPAVVSSWGCVLGARPIIMLMLTCADEIGNRKAHNAVCHGEKEWSRLIGTDGKRLDSGYLPQDRRYEALFSRLKIPGDNSLQDATGR